MKGLFTLVTMCLLAVPTQAKYSGGSGTAADPYQIATAADLIALGETPEDYDKHFVLTADIDLDPNLPGRKVFDKAVIAPDTGKGVFFQGRSFTGIFDGNGYTICRLTATGEDYLGLFGQLESGAEVKNLGVLDIRIIRADVYVGGLVGWSYGGDVVQCYSTGVVSGTSVVGGLVGYNTGGVRECYSRASVSGTLNVGGLVGENWSEVSNCYCSGMVSGTWRGVGGLVGFSRGSITMSYSISKVSGTESVGGLLGAAGGLPGMSVVVSGSFWNIETSGQTTSEGGTGKTTRHMQTAATFLNAGWDFAKEAANGTEDIWWLLEGMDYPHLSWEVPRTTTNVVELAGVDFDEAIAVYMPVLVNLYATWCPFCPMMAPVIEEIADEYVNKAKICRADIDKYPKLAGRFGVIALPTLILFKKGVEQQRWEGFVDKQELTTAIRELLQPTIQPDQTNLPNWAGGWILVRPKNGGQAQMWQTFTPHASSLAAVDIDVITANPVFGDDVLTIEIGKDGVILASAVRHVAKNAGVCFDLMLVPSTTERLDELAKKWQITDNEDATRK